MQIKDQEQLCLHCGESQINTGHPGEHTRWTSQNECLERRRALWSTETDLWFGWFHQIFSVIMDCCLKINVGGKKKKNHTRKSKQINISLKTIKKRPNAARDTAVFSFYLTQQRPTSGIIQQQQTNKFMNSTSINMQHLGFWFMITTSTNQTTRERKNNKTPLEKSTSILMSKIQHTITLVET